MTKDLEETLKELGPGYRPVVDRLVSAYSSASAVCPDAVSADPVFPSDVRRGFASGWGAAGLVAAAFLLFFGLSAVFRPSCPVRAAGDAKLVYTVAYAVDARALARIVSTQRADGSWANDFLTRQNAAALADATDVPARTAYKKAVRYLRSKGLRPLTAAELKARGDAAARASVPPADYS